MDMIDDTKGREVDGYIYWTTEVFVDRSMQDNLIKLFGEERFLAINLGECCFGEETKFKLRVTFEEFAQLRNDCLIAGSLYREYTMSRKRGCRFNIPAHEAVLISTFGLPAMKRTEMAYCDESVYYRPHYKFGFDITDLCVVAMIAAIWEYRKNQEMISDDGNVPAPITVSERGRKWAKVHDDIRDEVVKLEVGDD